MFWRLICIFVFLASLLGVPTPVQAAVPPSTDLETTKGPSPKFKIIEPTKVDQSPPLANILPMKINAPTERKLVPLGALPKTNANAAGLATQPDRALQSAPVTGQMPVPGINFDGIHNTYFVAPPDTNGDIGPKHYVQWVNLGLQVWQIDRAAGTATTVLGPIDGNLLWFGFGGPCENDNDGDPIVLYDPLADRWFLSQFAVTGGFYQCIAVSVTHDPTGAYYRYAYNWGVKMNDYPKFGVWPDGYYMTANLFTGSDWAGAGVGVFERQRMLLGQPARLIQLDLFDTNSNYGGMLPADLDGNPPPAGTPAYFAEVDDSSSTLGPVDALRIWEAKVDWDPIHPSLTFGQAANFGEPSAVLPVENFNIICQSTRDCIQQAGSNQALDAIGDRLMFRLAYRYFPNAQPYEAMVVNHTVLVNGRAGVRWYEIRRTNSVYSVHQQGTYAGDDPATDLQNRWMGSIAMDWQGNMALGYSLASETRYPSIGYTGRLTGDPLNSLPQGEQIAFPGTASQSDVNRWGDYSSMSVDPLDDCTFWYTQEYARGGWDWATRILAFKLPSCTPRPSGILSGKVTDGSGNPILGAIISAVGYTAVSGADGSYSFPRVAAGTYDMTTKASGYQPAAANNVMVTNGAITKQDFVLTALQRVSVTIRLTDGADHLGMPLYGWVDIASEDTPVERFYTNPVTGLVIVDLFQNIPYYLTAAAENYLPESRTATYTHATGSESIQLKISALLGCPLGYQQTARDFEGFEQGQAPPPDWYEYQLGDPGEGFSTSTSAYEGTYSAFHDDYRVSGQSIDTMIMPIQNLPDHPVLEFYEREKWGSYSVYHGVWLTTGADPDPRVSNYVEVAELPPGSDTAWQRTQVDLSAYAGMDVFLAFYYKGNYSDEWFIDNIRIVDQVCEVIEGGRVTGFVKDALNGSPLVGAQISSPSGTTFSTATPDDLIIEDGFYNAWTPSGATGISASYAQYGTVTASISIGSNEVFEHNFALSAGQLSVDPPSLSVNVVLSKTPVTMDLNIGNVGAFGLNYQVKEFYQDSEPVFNGSPSGPFAAHHRHVGPKNLNLPSLEDVVSYMGPVPGPQSPDKAATNWDSDLAFPWGIGFNTNEGDLWLGNAVAGGGDNMNYRFTTNGVNTGDTINISPWVDIFGADMTYDPYTEMLWQVNVGGDNCIYELDPDTRSVTGRAICPDFGTSERGLAYDPVTNTFYAGSWNDGVIHHFAPNGVILDSKDVGLDIAGLAYNPATGHLYVSENTYDQTDIFVLDTKNNYDLIDAFNITGLNGSKQGIEFDCQGQLWVVSTPYVFKTEPLENGVCSSLEIPWLSVSPPSGSAAPGISNKHAVTFNPTGLIPGEYTGYLGIFSDTPYEPQVVKFTLTITYVGRYYLTIIHR